MNRFSYSKVRSVVVHKVEYAIWNQVWDQVKDLVPRYSVANDTGSVFAPIISKARSYVKKSLSEF